MNHRVQTRWRDVDGLGHVNHAAAFDYFEEGRDAFLRSRGMGPADYVVGRCSVTWLREIKPETASVTVECVIREIGRTSFQTSERILTEDGEPAIEAIFGLVMWDSATSSPRPITDEERSMMTGGSEK